MGVAKAMTARARTTPWLGFLLVLGVAFAVRLAHLGDVSLDFDEYLHVFAGQQLVAQGRPLLPSGAAYTRAFPYTWMVSQSIRHFGTSEAAVRLPSVVFGVLLVLFAGMIAWRWWGVEASLVVMTLVAFDPHCLQMSRVCRMYAPFHLLYLIGFYAAYEGLEGKGKGARRAGWWCVAIASTLLALKLQRLAVELWVGVAGYLAVQSVLTRQRKYVIPTIVAAAGALVIATVKTAAVIALWHEVNSAPAYGAPWRYDYGFYIRHWWQTSPGMALLLVPALLWCIRSQGARGWYLACATLIPLGLHSLIFDWKEDRYLLHIVPVVLVVVGGAIWAWAKWLAKRVKRRSAAKASSQLAWVIVGGLLIPFGMAVLRGRSPSGLDGEVARWREAYALLRPQLRPEDQLIISVPLVSAYYLNRLPDYILLNVLVNDSGHQAPRGPEGLYRDWYSGRSLVTTRAEMEAVFRRHARGWIVVDRDRFLAETCVPADVRELITTRCRLQPSPDPSVVMYRWGTG